jgi:uncharacterized protein (TIGR02996 family)
MSTEKGFLDAILKEPDNLDHRLVYADWLEDQGDLRRAEFLRLEVFLDGLPPGDPRVAPTQARLRELHPEIGAEWLALLDRTTILNCLRGEACPGRWEKLELTVKARVRRCATCNLFVQHARSEHEAGELQEQGIRVAVDSRVDPQRLAYVLTYIWFDSIDPEAKL